MVIVRNESQIGEKVNGIGAPHRVYLPPTSSSRLRPTVNRDGGILSCGVVKVEHRYSYA